LKHSRLVRQAERRGYGAMLPLRILHVFVVILLQVPRDC
jgi:hypothetical protein